MHYFGASDFIDITICTVGDSQINAILSNGVLEAFVERQTVTANVILHCVYSISKQTVEGK